EMGSNVELVWPEAEAYSSRVNNCSHANSSLAAIRAKLSAEQLEQFKTSCFGHLLNIDKIQFSGQIVHGAVLRRVAGQGVKDLDGLSFLLGCDVAQFTRQDFCLITGLRFGEVPEVSSGESDEIRLQERYFIDEGITCNALEEAFLRCTEEDDIYKLALVYFAELVVLGRDKHLNINLNYLDPCRGLGCVQQIWVYELIPRMADLNYCKVVDPTAVPSVQLRALCPTEEEMRQPYWSWPQDRPAVVSAESIPSSCADLDELNKVGVKGQVIEMRERKRKEEGIEGGEVQGSEVEEGQRKRSEGEQVQVKLAQGVQLRKRKRIIPMWKIIEAVNWFQKLGTDNRTEDVRPNEGDSHDDLVNLLKLCWEWRQDPNLVMQFGNVEAEIEFLLPSITFVLALRIIKGKNSRLGGKSEKVPPCGMDWQNVYKVYTPFMLTKYKHWVAVMIDLVLCEIKVYDSKVSLIPDDIVKEELAPLSITLPNLLNTIDFYEEGVYANNCSRDWWCPWPIERVDVPQQSNEGDCGMFVLKYIELFSAQLPLATCTSHNMPFFRLKLAAEITRGDAYFP
ncbi:hypothetical protein Prudu_001362, partial [Prunus dulcis]